MARDKGHMTHPQLRHWIKAGKPLAKDYRARKLVSLAHSTQASYGRHRKRVEKKLGALAVREIEASAVVAQIEGAGLTWGESNMLPMTIKCLFTHACGKRLIDANPCHGIMLSAFPGERPPRRKRLMLTREELKLLRATAVRSAGLHEAQWADVGLDGAHWRIPNGRTGAAMDIPPAPIVVEWFRELPTLSGGSTCVLPAHSRSRAARHGGDTRIGNDTLREAINHWLGTATPAVRRFTPHDLRGSVKSHLRAPGVPRDISVMCLIHELSGVEGIHERHTYFEERREALGKGARVQEGLSDLATGSVPAACSVSWSRGRQLQTDSGCSTVSERSTVVDPEETFAATSPSPRICRSYRRCSAVDA